MKIIIILLLFAQISFGQIGTISYEKITKFVITDDMPEMIKKMNIPDLKSSFQLAFSENTALYKNVEKEILESDSKIITMGGNADYYLYTDRVEKKITEQMEFLGKKFLISGDMEKQKWKVTGESKIVLGHPCLKAVKTDTLSQTTAWFAMDIKVPLGPGHYGQLPGLILEVSNGKTLFIKATHIDLEKSLPFKKPKKGKKVTRAEYKQIQKEKLEELKSERSGSQGSRVITIGG